MDERLLEPILLFLDLLKLLVSFIELSLQLTHQLIAVGLRYFLNEPQLIRMPLLQLPILRQTAKQSNVQSHQGRGQPISIRDGRNNNNNKKLDKSYKSGGMDT